MTKQMIPPAAQMSDRH